MKDPYFVLGINKNASNKEVKIAYRKKCKQWHPDTNNGSIKATEKFKEVQEAFNAIINPKSINNKRSKSKHTQVRMKLKILKKNEKKFQKYCNNFLNSYFWLGPGNMTGKIIRTRYGVTKFGRKISEVEFIVRIDSELSNMILHNMEYDLMFNNTINKIKIK